MGNPIDSSDVVWLVVTDSHQWGASNSLYEAMQNAYLPEPQSPAKFFAEELEYSLDLGQALKDWNDFGKVEATMPSGEVYTIIIYRFDPGLWADWTISPIDGCVSFTQRKDMEADWEAEMKKARIVAEYTDGVLKPKVK